MMNEFELKGASFVLRAAQHVVDDTKTYIIIEGDGRAWVNKRIPSANPTPVDAIGLKIAQNFLPRNVVYLGRPCQFLTTDELKACESQYWMNNRYSQDILTIYSVFLNRIGGKKVLIGYSGGGVLAARLAQQRDDISTLVTISSPLSLSAWTRHHDVTSFPPMDDPTNHQPISTMTKQIHFFGEKDKIVPYHVAKPFIDKQDSRTVTVHKIKDFNHKCCWSNKFYDF